MQLSSFSETLLNLSRTLISKNTTSLVICSSQKEAEQVFLDLNFFWGQDLKITLFPDWEILPYDDFSPHQDIISKRLTILHQLSLKHNMVIVASMTTLLYRLCPPDFLKRNLFDLKVGQHLSLQSFKQVLSEGHYQPVSEVQVHGDYAIRGSMIDVFPMSYHEPIRIEWFDDEIASIRVFNPETQLSEHKIEALTLFPSREFPFDESARALFRQQFRQTFSGNPSLVPVYENVSKANLQQGLENYLPLFFESTASLFDYLPREAQIFYNADIKTRISSFWQEIGQRYEQRAYDVTKPILEPESCFFTPNDWFQKLKLHAHQELTQIQSLATELPNLKIDRLNQQPFHRLSEFIKTQPNQMICIFAPSPGKREVFLELCHASALYPESIVEFHHIKSPLSIVHGPIHRALFLQQEKILCLSEQELMGESVSYQSSSGKSKKGMNFEKLIRDLSELQQGMLVVHADFGIGRYEGLQKFENQGILSEFLTLSYAEGDKIYVPITSLSIISKYNGQHSDQTQLHKLGSQHWQKEKRKAAEKIHDIAVDLLETQAHRHGLQGYAAEVDWSQYERFAASFRFDETEDQKQAIAAIINDMQAPQPMDRLICGDVGFGKTEVAMRAAFIMALNHKQVCVLVPTTLLAKQHFETFQERFANFPIQVELISRFRSKKEALNILDQLQAGKVDILIGTHKLLQQDIKFKDLGLLIIDEEHRFGVKQKEHLKRIRHQADILSLTATPIPRTLNMAMHGLRDISLIATPPAKRLAIKTFWHEKNHGLIREAMLREILRGGQVYYLHNDILTIEKTTAELRNLVPEASIEFAHGQMPERRLEQIMGDFYHQRFNVLVCTTIIETGIDIPTANTIIIERADHLGLAQIHQLRGRVGRSHHQAYAYLLTPPAESLTQDAVKRLEAIVSLENLGAGFSLAIHDMEIRGAGELLGEEQSGNMQSIGYSLYMEMLDQAINDIKEGRLPQFEQQTKVCDIDLRLSSIIPDDYMPDVNQRLIFYKRISSVKTKDDLKHIQIELIDRFGLFPQPLKNLFASMLIQLTCIELGIVKLHLSPNMGVIEFNQNPNINPSKLISLIQTQEGFKLKGQQFLQFELDPCSDATQRLKFIEDLLLQLK